MDEARSSGAHRVAAFESIFQSAWYRLVLLFSVVYQIVFWFVLGPSSAAYAVGIVGTTFALGPALAAPVMHRVPRQWFRVPARERAIHRILGIGLRGWLLDVSGWNRVVAKPMRGFSGKKTGLLFLEQGLRGNVSAHGTCFAIHA
jgi:hypothetical protein